MQSCSRMFYRAAVGTLDRFWCRNDLCQHSQKHNAYYIWTLSIPILHLCCLDDSHLSGFQGYDSLANQKYDGFQDPKNVSSGYVITQW